MFNQIKVYNDDVRHDGSIPQECEDGPGIHTMYIACCRAHVNYDHKYMAFQGHMYGSQMETRIPLKVLKRWVDETVVKSFDYDFFMGKLKDYYHMWQ